ncbi:MAG TPA: hypothetical protein VFT02_06395 [Pyrinomonadaceae bacterium]|nr:hypothetical protein [Pyrinomonadaceae bacterium]
MKVPGLLLLVLLLAVAVSAQTSESQQEPAADLTVIKKSWRREIHNPALTSDPFRSNDEQAELQRAQKDNAVRNSVRVREGNTPQPTMRTTRPIEPEPDGPSTSFVYRVTVKNVGKKTIKSLAWDYLFYDREKGELVGDHSFRQRIRIRPGQSVELTGRTRFPPTHVINVTKAQQQAAFSEEISFSSIDYEDGSSWRRPLKGAQP